MLHKVCCRNCSLRFSGQGKNPPNVCPRCKCGVLDSIGIIEGTKVVGIPNKTAPIYNDGVNQSPDRRNSGTRLNSPGRDR